MCEERICSMPHCHHHLNKCNCDTCYINYLNNLEDCNEDCELFCKNCSIEDTAKINKKRSSKLGIKNTLCSCKKCKEHDHLLDKWLWHLFYNKEYLKNKYFRRWLFAYSTPGEKIFELPLAKK